MSVSKMWILEVGLLYTDEWGEGRLAYLERGVSLEEQPQDEVIQQEEAVVHTF